MSESENVLITQNKYLTTGTIHFLSLEDLQFSSHFRPFKSRHQWRRGVEKLHLTTLISHAKTPQDTSSKCNGTYYCQWRLKRVSVGGFTSTHQGVIRWLDKHPATMNNKAKIFLSQKPKQTATKCRMTLDFGVLGKWCCVCYQHTQYHTWTSMCSATGCLN